MQYSYFGPASLCHQAIAIVFDLMNPARPAWWEDGGSGKAGLDEADKRSAGTQT
jgi:hypothetical protein